jgi:FeS assembly protein SufD
VAERRGGGGVTAEKLAAPQASALLAALGAPADAQLPTAKTESWKYSSLRALNQAAVSWQAGALGAIVTDTNSPALRAGASVPVPNGAKARPTHGVFASIAASQPAFNYAVAGGANIDYFTLAPSTDSCVVQGAHVLSLGANAAATLLWHHSGSASKTFANFLTQISLAEGAQLTLIRVQQASATASVLERTEVQLASGAALNVFDINLGAQWARHELTISLDGPGAHAAVHVLSALRGRQHVDTQLCLNHNSVNTTSSTRVKTVADDRTRSVFNGRIFVAKGSDGTDAQLQTNNLLLSEHAEVDVKPELEIYAEDVKCSHGATVGQLDANALFYLRSRGIDAVQARTMLTLAFCQEVLDGIEDAALRSRLSAIMHAQLPSLIAATGSQ